MKEKDWLALQDTLEKLIDKHSLKDVLHNLTQVCYGKAEHLRENWQDQDAAKKWESAGLTISRTADKVPLL